MQLIDIHTHKSVTENAYAIVNHSLLDGDIPEKACYVSLSIHPWYLTANNADVQLEKLKSLLSSAKVVAIGECGIDKMCDAPIDLQIQIFEEVAKFARDNSFPLIIHAVKSSNEIIEVRRKLGYDGTWIIHGFRGKPELATAYLKHDISFSFGEKYNAEALRTVPLKNLFLETDESKLSIDEIAQKVSDDYGIEVGELKKEVSGNISRCFPFYYSER